MDTARAQTAMSPTGEFSESEPGVSESLGPDPTIAPDGLPGEPPLSVRLLAGFSGRINPPRFSLLYQVSLSLVAGFMVLLPVLYLSLIAGVAWATWWYASHAGFLLTGRSYSVHLFILLLVLYLGPLFAGATVVLFMFKPIFAPRARTVQPLAINPGAEPVLYAFICKICDLVRAPMPSMIALSCDVNASAGLRRGLFSRELTLTLGLPLVAGLPVNQLAGVIAHEFGHFTQGLGMRLTYIIRTINAWFMRVVYQRDSLDVWLKELAGNEGSLSTVMVASMALLAVWFSRLILRLLMYAGQFASCYALRQMEYGADEFEINVAGSAAFEASQVRLQSLGAAEAASHQILKTMWEREGRLPENVAAFILQVDASMAPEARTRIENQAGLQPTGWFDTHPSVADRVRRARQLAAPGVFHLDWPSSLLFQNFEALARQVTLTFYLDEIGLPLQEKQLVPVHHQPPEAEPTPGEPSESPAPQDAHSPKLRIRRPAQ